MAIQLWFLHSPLIYSTRPPPSVMCPYHLLNLTPAEHKGFLFTLILVSAGVDGSNHALSQHVVLVASRKPRSPRLLILPHWLPLLSFLTRLTWESLEIRAVWTDEETWPWAEWTWGTVGKDLHTFVDALGQTLMRTMHQWDPTAQSNQCSSCELQTHECFYKLGQQKDCVYPPKKGGGGYLKNPTGRQGQRLVTHTTWLQTSTKHSLEFKGCNGTPLGWFSCSWTRR